MASAQAEPVFILEIATFAVACSEILSAGTDGAYCPEQQSKSDRKRQRYSPAMGVETARQRLCPCEAFPTVLPHLGQSFRQVEVKLVRSRIPTGIVATPAVWQRLAN